MPRKKEKRLVKIEFSRDSWFVVYVDRKKGQRYSAAQFDNKNGDCPKEKVIQWIQEQPELTLHVPEPVLRLPGVFLPGKVLFVAGDYVRLREFNQPERVYRIASCGLESCTAKLHKGEGPGTISLPRWFKPTDQIQIVNDEFSGNIQLTEKRKLH